MADGQIDLVLAFARQLEQRVDNLALLEFGDLLLFVAAFEYQRVVAANAVFLGFYGIAVGIDKLVAKPPAIGFQFGQQQFELRVLAALHKGQGVNILIQGFERLDRQIGDAVQLALGQVEALGIAIAQEIDHRHDAEDHNPAPEGIEPATVLAKELGVEHPSHHHQHHAQAQIEKPRSAARRIHDIGQSPGNGERRAGQPQRCGISFHPLAPPSPRFDDPRGQEQAEEGKAHIEDHVLGVDDATLEVLEVFNKGEILEDLGRRRPGETGRPVDEPEQ